MNEILKRFEKLVAEVLAEDVFELVEVEEAGRCLRVFVDKPGGVSLKDCARLSGRLSERLDMEDFIPYRYTLEVSSPGLDRPLKKEDDYLRFQGRRVRITTSAGRLHTGRLVGLEGGTVKIEEGAPKVRGQAGGPGGGRGYLTIPLSQIKRARLEME